MPDYIRRLPYTLDRAGIRRSALYDWICRGLWTAPVSLGRRAVGWPESEIDALIRARIAGKSDDEIRQLVQDLELARKAAA